MTACARVVICPTGGLLTGLSSLISGFPKNISVPTYPKSHLELSPSRPTERGVSRSSRTLGMGCGGRGSVLRATGSQGGFFESVSGQQRADERCCCVRRSRVVLTPRCWRQVRGVCVGPTGLRQDISADDGGKRARSPGRARRKPLKPLRAGTSGDSGVLVVTRVRSTNTKCTRGRGCNGHPAFPTPSLGERFINGSGAWRGEGERVSATRICNETPSFRDAPLGAGPESILPVVVMDSGLALRAPRNDGSQLGCCLKIKSEMRARGASRSPRPARLCNPEDRCARRRG